MKGVHVVVKEIWRINAKWMQMPMITVDNNLKKERQTMVDVTLEIIIGLLILAIIAVIVIVTSGVKIVQPYQQGVYMRLGSYVRILDQGLNFVTPLINTSNQDRPEDAGTGGAEAGGHHQGQLPRQR